jgi:hypothetical protein
MTWHRTLSCLLALGWVGASPAPAAASQALLDALACRSTISKQGRVYADKRRRLLLKCIDKVLKCELRLEVEGDNPNACRDGAKKSCTNTIGPAADSALNKAIARFEDKAEAACLAMGYANMLSTGSGGLWFNNDTTCNAEPDLLSFLACLRGEIEVEVDGVVGRLKPRGGVLLDNLDSENLGNNFPNLPRPASVPVVVSATSGGSGILVNPGTINILAGEAVQFSGDESTLPCGMSDSNGRLTITVGPAGTVSCPPPNTLPALTQQLEIKEDYGPARTATFGPYTADQDYCLELRDGSCNEPPESGLIDVP